MADGSHGVADIALDVVGDVASAVGSELKKTTQSVFQQVTDPQKGVSQSQTPAQLQQRAQQDKQQSDAKAEKIQKELEMMHFRNVQSWDLNPQPQEQVPEEEQPTKPELGDPVMPGSKNTFTSHALKNALDKTETGRGKKG